MNNIKESFILSRELQLLTDEYNTAPADIKSIILEDIKLLTSAIALLLGEL
ncbi:MULTISPECIES: hypothetical protein [Sporosarcina]|uniref:hypothetical protein n=1 Tax=Sporosarcina TaxID=1569 RepID=UPI00129A2D4C|nr:MULTISPECIES: hypothetical protein [Sporosarcina]GKV64036.1 hypothetical protein NCCP2331_01890 [Sporosarcina sp. NCCP-2331]GLB56390.1 hypothetical protein NCCP2378_21770 [Sporosarcina sp. NCCP-2378]